MPLVKLSFKSAKRYSNNPNWVKTGPYKQYGKAGTDAVPVSCDTRTLCEGNCIPKHCIANMIAVLMGDRPFPKHRSTFFTDNTYMKKYYDIVDRTYINVKTSDKNLSIQQTNKEMYSAKKDYHPTIILDGIEITLNRDTPSHSIISLAMGVEYSEFNAMCNKILGNDYKIMFTILQTISELRKLYILNDDCVVLWVNKNKWENKNNLQIYNNFIIPIKTGKISEGNAFRFENGWKLSGVPHWMAPNNIKGIETNVQTMCGEIAINATEQEIEQIKRGNGVATLMEGGVVTIEEIGYWTSEFESWQRAV